MKTFSTLAEFKRILEVNDKLECTRHTFNPCIYPVRKVTIKQTNCFALETKLPDGRFENSYLEYPKARECKVENNQLIILENGNPYLTYSFAK